MGPPVSITHRAHPAALASFIRSVLVSTSYSDALAAHRFTLRGTAPLTAMPRRKPPSLEQRLDQVETSITELKKQLTDLGATGDEVAAMHDDVDELRRAVESRRANPETKPLSPKAKAQRADNAAVARASKDVGEGQGKVRTKATQAKLRKQAGATTKRKR